MKAAIYARYSSDNQREASIEDQIRVCRMRADKEGWQITEIYTDYALSGASLMRAGVQGLIQDALAGKIDLVLSEDLDRISRDQEDIAGFYKRMEFADVKIFTLSDGEINDLHIGLKGTMSSRFLKDLADKTRRGLRGRVENGKSGGGKTYGYDVVHQTGANGEIERGGRKINDDQAKVVNRIFEEYVSGRSPKNIAVRLNQEGIPGPSGKAWGPTTINGNRERGTGILNNEIYIGKLIWNRLRYVKDPDTRKRVSRINPIEDWVVKDAPHFRILDQELWDRVKAKQGTYAKRTDALWRKNRPKNLLSYLIKCGVCGGGCSQVSQTHIGCSTARNKGTCDNRRTIKREALEERIIGALKTHLMDKDLCAEFCKEYTNHMNLIRREHNAARARYERELVKVEKEKDQLVAAVLNGIPGDVLKEKGEYIVKRKAELEGILASMEEAPIVFHPSMAERYHEEVANLIDALNDQNHRAEASELLRSLIDKIVLTPTESESGLSVDLIGDLAGILSVATKGDKPLVESGLSFMNQSQQDDDSVNKEAMVAGGRNTHDLLPVSTTAMVAGVGFEPTTFRL